MKIFSVIGDPIMHSISPRMHNNAIAYFNENAIYTRYHLQDYINLKKIVKIFDGVNITIPFKEQAFDIADFKDQSVSDIKSANTLIVKNNKIYAYNTDYLGFLKAIEEFKNIKSALILGAGGTSKAIAYALKTKCIKTTIVNRSKERFLNFVDFPCYLYDQLPLDENFDLIVNTTSAGLCGDNFPCKEELLNKLFANSRYVFDVVYGKTTPFLKLAKKHSLKAKDGKDMLLWQGVYAFELFFENHDIKNICKAMDEALQFC
ncbi:shikimate dehydrogenase [Campylobacter volucris]|uniref:shikimate dehydrogenase n=1 Tax=Campylobacter volucris TaxID=1031542 RepID=UPI00189FE944|nr:shikimate dehydrogenase [Campylobacter volucris]MBF7067136.1 shikimate dehydrogenase [Campylobacter volucris]